MGSPSVGCWSQGTKVKGWESMPCLFNCHLHLCSMAGGRAGSRRKRLPGWGGKRCSRGWESRGWAGPPSRWPSQQAQRELQPRGGTACSKGPGSTRGAQSSAASPRLPTSNLSAPLSRAAGRLWRVSDTAERLLPIPLRVPARQPAPLLPGCPAECECSSPKSPTVSLRTWHLRNSWSPCQWRGGAQTRWRPAGA